MKETEPVRFAVLGAGQIGKRHADTIQQDPDALLCALCDNDPLQRELLSGYNVPVFDDAEQMLEMVPDIDVLAIATPNFCHIAHALLGLKKKKHIIIEKPMALKSSDCETIIRVAQEVSREVFCVMQNRYSPPSVWLKEVLKQGLLGNIYMVQINCFWNRDERYYENKKWRGLLETDGGTLFTQFSHFIDMMYWLFGDIKNIHSSFFDFNHSGLTEFEDSGMLQFGFVNGGSGSFQYSTSVWDRNMESTLMVIAENGTVKIGGQYMNEVEYCHIKNYEMPLLEKSGPANDYGGFKGSAANHRFVYRNVIDVLRSKTSITTNASEGLKVVEIIERIYRQNPFITQKKKL